MNNTVSLLTADGTVMTDIPEARIRERIRGPSCKPNLFYYADECMTNGYPFSSLGKASAGNSVRPALAFALACVSAAVAALPRDRLDATVPDAQYLADAATRLFVVRDAPETRVATTLACMC